MAEDIILPEHLPFYIKGNNVGTDLVSVQAKANENFVGMDLTESLSLKKIISRVSKDTERKIILEVLKKTKGNKAETARLLKINYKTLYNKIKEYKIE